MGSMVTLNERTTCYGKRSSPFKIQSLFAPGNRDYILLQIMAFAFNNGSMITRRNGT